MTDLPFRPSPDVAVILNTLLDIFERRGGSSKQVIRVKLSDLNKVLPGYYSQIDPNPRLIANEQLMQLTQRGFVSLTWELGQSGHLLEMVTLEIVPPKPLYTLLARQPLAEQRQQLRGFLLAERANLSGWRRATIEHTLKQLKAQKSPAPFSLTNFVLNQDLLTILLALPDEEVQIEVPYRVFSVRIFNDSKLFESLKDTIARLARRHNPVWHGLPEADVLREMGLVANPGHLYLHGPWELIDEQGQIITLSEFYPSVGIPAALAARVRLVRVDTPQVICVENATPFYELIRHQSDDFATICLWGNPSPACRHLLRQLATALAPEIPLYLWADIDYGGLNILLQLRQQVSAHFRPYQMDKNTLETYAKWGRPLSANDRRNLKRLRQHPLLQDMRGLIDYILQKEVKLEQEAIELAVSSTR